MADTQNLGGQELAVNGMASGREAVLAELAKQGSVGQEHDPVKVNSEAKGQEAVKARLGDQNRTAELARNAGVKDALAQATSGKGNYAQSPDAASQSRQNER